MAWVLLGAVALIISVVVAVYFSTRPTKKSQQDPYSSQFFGPLPEKDRDPSAKVLALSRRTPVARVARDTSDRASDSSVDFGAVASISSGDDSSSSYDGGGDCGGSSGDCGGGSDGGGGGGGD